jgi:hypothetical protein
MIALIQRRPKIMLDGITVLEPVKRLFFAFADF